MYIQPPANPGRFNTDLTTNSFVLAGKLAVLGSNHLRVTLRVHPFVQGRKATPRSSAPWRRKSPPPKPLCQAARQRERRHEHRRNHGAHRRARSTKAIEHCIARLAAIADGALDQCHWLPRRIKVIPRRLVEVPDIPLVARTAPVMLYASLPAIEHGFELLMIVCAAQRKGVLGPDDGAGPFAARFLPGAMQRWPLGGRHANIAWTCPGFVPLL
jgi:hypothetical protein